MSVITHAKLSILRSPSALAPVFLARKTYTDGHCQQVGKVALLQLQSLTVLAPTPTVIFYRCSIVQQAFSPKTQKTTHRSVHETLPLCIGGSCSTQIGTTSWKHQQQLVVIINGAFPLLQSQVFYKVPSLYFSSSMLISLLLLHSPSFLLLLAFFLPSSQLPPLLLL